MKRKKVLMACVHSWDSTFQVGSHQLARGFVKAGWEVGFISHPVSPLLLLGKREGLEERLNLYRSGGRRDLDGQLWAYTPGTLLLPRDRPFLRSPYLMRRWVDMTWPNLIRKLAGEGFGQVDLLYFDSPFYLRLLEEVVHRKSVFRIADQSSGFACFSPAMKHAEEDLANKVDCVVYTASGLETYVREMQPKQMQFLPNGVNFTHFADGSRELPAEFAKIPRPIALYVGAMDLWFDYELINYATEALPDVSFVLVGPEDYARTRLNDRANLFLLGRKSYDDLPRYLHNADVGLVPFDVKGHPELVHNINPLKLYEYLACGLPVVATEWRELNNIDSPAHLCNDKSSFVHAITSSIATNNDKEDKINFAAKFDWAKNVETLADFLGDF